MKKYVIGADIGGTTVKIGVFTVEGELLDKWEIPTVTDNQGEQILKDIAASCEDYMKEHHLDKNEFLGIGMGVPGMVDESGIVIACVNLGWRQRDAKKEMEEILGIPAFMENDANAAALGEMWEGQARGRKDMVLLTLGTGLGAGVIVDEKTIRGSHGYGGEIGHLIVEPEETEPCNCGKKGCLEQYCSATGIVRMAGKALENYQGETLLRNEELTSKAIFQAAEAGDAFALSQVERFGRDLGLAMANLAAVMDPEVFVIGGGVSRAGKILTDVVGKYFREYAFKGQQGIEILLATLGNDAGIYGCARLAIGEKL